jgi:hypothetical protein
MNDKWVKLSINGMLSFLVRSLRTHLRSGS